MVKDLVKDVAQTELQHKHPFHFKEFYKMMHDWFEENGYKSANGGDDYENFYNERIHDGGMKEIRYWWHLYKAPSKYSVNEVTLVKFHLTVRIRALGIKDIETVFNGKKTKVQDGELTVDLKQDITVSYSVLNGHWLSNFPLITNFIENRWYKKYFEMYKKMAYEDFYKLENTVKRWLNWYQYSLVPRPFRSSLGGYNAKSEFEK
ncbi:hypothetical protein JXM83_03570 [Candidatus Woesearchaeota archaeon]|nr:hypothetical protein [Candidatus Woesearchaeota archaeon]